MRFSMNIIFLGWWMAGQWVLSRAQPYPKPYPKPSVSMSSSEVVTQGENITIRCKNENLQQAEFSLGKQVGSSIHYLDRKKAEQNEVIFTISSASQSNAGIYRCIYCSEISTKYYWCSDYSDEVHVNVRDPNLGKPTIKVRPRGPLASGLNVTIECQAEAPGNGLNFSLYKSKVLQASQVTQPNGGRAEFSFFLERTEEAATCTCQYSRRENPFVWSEPSDSVELLARERPMIILWAGCAAGLLLVLLLLLLAFVLYRKRRKGSTAKERNQAENMPLETFVSTDHDGPIYSSHHDGVTYAILNQHSLNTERAAVPERAPEPCIYASVAKDRIQEGL